MTFPTLRAVPLAAALLLGAASALAQPDVTVTPNPLDLDTLSVPGGLNPALTVRNDGTAPLVLTDAFVTQITDGFFGEAFGDGVAFPLTLGAGEEVDLTLIVSPAVGRQDATLTVESNDPDEPTVVVPITYFGTTVTFDVAPEAIDFGSVFVQLGPGGDPISPPTVCRPLAISAEGDEEAFAHEFEVDVPFGAPSLSGDQFSIDGVDDLSDYSVPVSPGDTTVVDVCYTPNQEGEAVADLFFVVQSSENSFNGIGFDVDLTAEATTTNAPPVPQGIADGDVFDVVVDTPRTISFSFASPEAGQVTTIEVSEPLDFFDSFVTTTPGNPAMGEIEISVLNGTGGAETGAYVFGIEACDDATDGDGNDVSECTTVEITVNVDYPPTKTCDFDVWFYINTFGTDPADNYFQLYSEESGLVDLTGCSFVAFDAASEKVVVSLPLTFELYPYGEPRLFAGVDFDGAIPEGPGAIAIVKGAPALGDDVSTVLGKAVNAIVYRTADDVVGVCGEGTPFNASGDPVAPCVSTASESTVAAALSQIGTAVSAEDAAELDLSLAVAPNPMARAGTVSFGLAEAGDAYVALFDALGRQVSVLADGPHGVGRHDVALDTSALPAGVYVVRALIGGAAQTTQLTVVR